MDEMDELLEFLAKSDTFYVATVDENNFPRVRPFNFVMEWDGKLAFGTGKHKNFYKQLVQNPKIEICAYEPKTSVWLRIWGETRFVEDKDAFRQMFEIQPELEAVYKDVDNPLLCCFVLDKGEAGFYSYESMNKPYRTILL